MNVGAGSVRTGIFNVADAAIMLGMAIVVVAGFRSREEPRTVRRWSISCRSRAFPLTIKIFNGNPFVYVSPARAAAIKPGWRRPLPVLVRINGQPKEKPWRINMMPIGGGDFYLYLHGDVRRASRTKVGDRVRVEVEFDSAYRNGPMHPMPSWFRIPLSRNARAKSGMGRPDSQPQEGNPPYFSWLKSPEARARNVARALHVLSGKGGRFMARSW